MAANQAAPKQRVVPEQESTERFDRIRFERVQMEVHLPGYDVNRAIARAHKKRRVDPPPATAPVVAEPVVFGTGSPASATPSPQSLPAPAEPELKLEL